MNTFLNKLSTIDSVQDIYLLSTLGDPLYLLQKKPSKYSKKTICKNWVAILKDLEYPPTVELIFTHGTYYAVHCAIGHLVIGVIDEGTLMTVKEGCDTIISKLSESHLCKRALLNLLSSASNEYKAYIIKQLVPYADAEVGTLLISLLQKENGSNADSANELLLLICQVLGYCQSYDAFQALNQFLQMRRPKDNVEGNVIFEAVKISLEQLKQAKVEEQHHPPQPQERTTPVTKKSSSQALQPQQKKANGVLASSIKLPQQQKVQAMLEKGQTNDAVQLILALIENCANKKEFTTACHLREWLIEINPMALTEIIHSAEFIENAKQSSIQKDHLKTWQPLVDILGIEEFSSLYHEMTIKSYTKGKTIVKQGALARTLIFINSGKVQIESQSQGRIMPLQLKGAGEVAGAGVFFTASVWTVSAKSHGCELFLLPRKRLDSLLQNHPSLESKLFDFCSSFHSTSDQLKKSSKNRRQFPRKDVSGRVTFVVLDMKGNAISNEAKGNLLDISLGGVAFSIHSSLKKNAIALFGRQLKITLNTGETQNVLIRHGKVKAVRDIDLIGNEYSLHIEFNKQLSSSEVLKVVNCQHQ